MRRIDIGDRNVFRTDGFVGQLTWPFLNAKPWDILISRPFACQLQHNYRPILLIRRYFGVVPK